MYIAWHQNMIWRHKGRVFFRSCNFLVFISVFLFDISAETAITGKKTALLLGLASLASDGLKFQGCIEDVDDALHVREIFS